MLLNGRSGSGNAAIASCAELLLSELRTADTSGGDAGGGADHLHAYGAALLAEPPRVAASVRSYSSCRGPLLIAYTRRTKLCANCMRASSFPLAGEAHRFCQRCHKAEPRACQEEAATAQRYL